MLRLKTCCILGALSLLALSGFGQDSLEQPGRPGFNETVPVNWLYGAIIPKGAPVQPLNYEERFDLYLRQTYSTTGMYIKTGFFVIHDQGVDAPPGWGRGVSGFGKRLGSIESQNMIQSSITSLGDALVKVEPRYDRCLCEGAWPRLRHAVVRNFVTYGGPGDTDRRPQIVPYAAALGAGVVVATWEPQNRDRWAKGYQGVITQMWFGALIDTLAEFAPDMRRKFRRNEKDAGVKLRTD